MLYIVTTAGVPLRIKGAGGSGMTVDGAAVDSELALLYADMHSGRPHPLRAPSPIPSSGKWTRNFLIPSSPFTW